jgi:hypothetical protein
LRQGWQGSGQRRYGTAVGWKESLCDTQFARFAFCDAIIVGASRSTCDLGSNFRDQVGCDFLLSVFETCFSCLWSREACLALCWLQACFCSSDASSAMRVIVHKLGARAIRHQCTAALQRSYGQPVPLRISTFHLKPFSSSKPHPLWSGPKTVYSQPMRHVSSAQKARDLNQQGIDEQESGLDHDLSEEREKQARTPWHREGADEPPVRRQRSAGAMTKG